MSSQLLPLLCCLTLSLSILSGCFNDPANSHHSPEVLSILSLEGMISDQVVTHFEQQTGVDIQVTTYKDPVAIINLLGQDSNYDAVIASSYYVRRLIDNDALMPIDHSKIHNLQQLNPVLLDPVCDPNNTYSVPYLWGTTALAFHTDTLASLPETDIVQDWPNLWQERWQNQVVLVDDMRSVFGITLMSLGYSSNSENPEQIHAAYERLRELLPNITAFSDNSIALLVSGQGKLGMANSHQYFNDSEDTKELTYTYPQSGALIWVDNFVIPKTAQNTADAHRFIDFALRAENAQIISDKTGLATPNVHAKLFNSEDSSQNLSSYPNEKQLANSRLQIYLDDEVLETYQYFWDKLKTEYDIMHGT